MSIFKYIIIILGIYAYLFNPLLSVFGGMGLCKILYFFAFVYILAEYKSFRRSLLVFKKEFSLLALLIIFVLLRTLIGGDSVILYTRIILLIESFIIPLAFAVYWTKQKQGEGQLIKCILIVSSVAAIISTLCVVNPSFGYYVRNELQISSDYIIGHEFRGFGVSDSLLSSYGYIQGACFALAYKYIKQYKWVIIFMPFILFSSFVNARTGLIIAVIGLLIVWFSNRSIKSGIALTFFVAALIYFVPFFMNIINPSERTVDFMKDFFEQMASPGENTTVATLNNGFKLPSDVDEWFIGQGIDIFQADVNKRSDVGYSIQLNYGGICYLLILYGLIFVILKKMYRYKIDSFFPLFFAASLLLLNYKANILSNSGFFRMVMMVYFVLMLSHRKFIDKNHYKTQLLK